MSSNREIDVKELLAKVDSGAPLLLLDVRNDDEYESWKIEGRSTFDIAHIPYFDFIEDEQGAVKRLPKHHGEVVTVCAKGGSSEMVAEILRDAGVPTRNLVGGMIAYGEYLAPVKLPVQLGEGDALSSGSSTGAAKVVSPTLSSPAAKPSLSIRHALLKSTNRSSRDRALGSRTFSIRTFMPTTSAADRRLQRSSARDISSTPVRILISGNGRIL